VAEYYNQCGDSYHDFCYIDLWYDEFVSNTFCCNIDKEQTMDKYPI